jgi:hypothetical protein
MGPDKTRSERCLPEPDSNGRSGSAAHLLHSVRMSSCGQHRGGQLPRWRICHCSVEHLRRQCASASLFRLATVDRFRSGGDDLRVNESDCPGDGTRRNRKCSRGSVVRCRPKPACGFAPRQLWPPSGVPVHWQSGLNYRTGSRRSICVRSSTSSRSARSSTRATGAGSCTWSAMSGSSSPVE